jgi:hypothetical protein
MSSAFKIREELHDRLVPYVALKSPVFNEWVIVSQTPAGTFFEWGSSEYEVLAALLAHVKGE